MTCRVVSGADQGETLSEGILVALDRAQRETCPDRSGAAKPVRAKHLGADTQTE